MANGSLAWGSRVSYFDVWTTTCIPLIPGVADCPVKDSPDYGACVHTAAGHVLRLWLPRNWAEVQASPRPCSQRVIRQQLLVP